MIFWKKKPFNQFIKENSVVDEITDKKWTESGVKNYAEVSLDDTLLRAREKMKNISSKQKVRGLVLDNQGQPVGVITYDLFSESINKWAEKGKLLDEPSKYFFTTNIITDRYV